MNPSEVHIISDSLKETCKGNAATDQRFYATVLDLTRYSTGNTDTTPHYSRYEISKGTQLPINDCTPLQ